MEAKLTFAAAALIAATSAMGQAQWQVTKITEASGRENWACEPSVAVDPQGSSVYLGNVLNQLHRNKRNGAPMPGSLTTHSNRRSGYMVTPFWRMTTKAGSIIFTSRTQADKAAPGNHGSTAS